MDSGAKFALRGRAPFLQRLSGWGFAETLPAHGGSPITAKRLSGCKRRNREKCRPSGAAPELGCRIRSSGAWNHEPEPPETYFAHCRISGVFGGEDPSSSLRNQVAYGVPDDLSHGMAIELFHQVDAMRLGCLYADAQDCGDFLAALALGEKLYDFALTRSQRRVRIRGNLRACGLSHVTVQ